MDTTATTAPTFRTILRNEAPGHAEIAILTLIGNVHSELESTNDQIERAAMTLAQRATQIAEAIRAGQHSHSSPTQDAVKVAEFIARREFQNRSLSELLFILQDEELRSRLAAAR